MHYLVEALERRGRSGDAMASVGVLCPPVVIAGQVMSGGVSYVRARVR